MTTGTVRSSGSPSCLKWPGAFKGPQGTSDRHLLNLNTLPHTGRCAVSPPERPLSSPGTTSESCATLPHAVLHDYAGTYFTSLCLYLCVAPSAVTQEPWKPQRAGLPPSILSPCHSRPWRPQSWAKLSQTLHSAPVHTGPAHHQWPLQALSDPSCPSRLLCSAFHHAGRTGAHQEPFIYFQAHLSPT